MTRGLLDLLMKLDLYATLLVKKRVNYQISKITIEEKGGKISHNHQIMYVSQIMLCIWCRLTKKFKMLYRE